MKQIKRDIPEGKAESYSLKNISYNNKGNIFLIFTHKKETGLKKVPTRNGKKVIINLEELEDEELLICLNENEARELIKFVEMIE